LTKKRQVPAAFLSYVHDDDKYEHITKFRERLGDEVQMVVGDEFIIFQDRKDIHWGQGWRQRLEESIDEVTFLIPIITPRFFNSPYCREELQRFLEREKTLGRSNLILPIYFVDTPLLNDGELRAKDELAQAIASRQYADWRNLRHEPFTNPLIGRTLEKLAMQIRDALPTIAPQRQPPTAPVPQPPETLQANAPAEDSGKKLTTTRPTKVEPLTRVVDPMHRGDFATISEAIATSAPGTRILVRPGLYPEALIINKPLEIIGDGELGDVVVQVSGKHVILFQTTMGRVANLTLKQTGGGYWFAVNIAQGRLELEDCDVTSQSLSCVAIHNGADPRLRRNRIHDSKKGGVHVYENGVGTLEDNDIFGNAGSGVGITTGGNPTLRRNRIHAGQQSGVHVYENGVGTLEDNDIFGNASSGVQIKLGGNPILRRNRIHDCKGGGVLVSENGLSTLEDNDIFSSASVGVEVREGGNPTLRNNRINKNRYQAIWVHHGGEGTFEGNDLRGNLKGAWLIAPDCEANVKRSNNQE
jgi:parallel beta-helix repeat protein